jgi:hypothetical protein
MGLLFNRTLFAIPASEEMRVEFFKALTQVVIPLTFLFGNRGVPIRIELMYHKFEFIFECSQRPPSWCGCRRM